MLTDSISIKEEKRLLAEIQELERNRPKVAQVQTLEATGNTHQTDLGGSPQDKVQEFLRMAARAKATMQAAGPDLHGEM
eukprot:12906219-Prorocentrum_lima.AAC.1